MVLSKTKVVEYVRTRAQLHSHTCYVTTLDLLNILIRLEVFRLGEVE